jgi:uncharacterized protein involved in type VI secretion and phage assembly
MVRTNIELQGKKIARCLGLTLTQDLHNHHYFEIIVPYDELESKDSAFFDNAHQQVVGQIIKISFDKALEDGSFDFQFKGVVTGLGLKQKDLSSVFVIKGYSPTIVMEDVTIRQAFVSKSLGDIFKGVTLALYPSNVLKRNFNPRHTDTIAYSVQYDETNFTFLSRLAREYGEWFYYDGTQLCLGDPDDGESKDFKVDGIQTFNMSVDLKPIKFNLSSYDYMKNETGNVDSDREEVDGLNPFGSFALNESRNLFSNDAELQPFAFPASDSDLITEVKERLSGIAAKMVVFSGSGVTPELSIGTVIKVSGSMPQIGGRSNDDSFGDYRVTGIVHRVDDKGNYSSQFTAVPKSLKIPPANPNVTRPIAYPQVGTVLDNSDPEKLGRVRVQFNWSTPDGNNVETTWVRVGTFYAGGNDGKGCLFIPEVGAQVMIDFENGDPNYPFVQTSLYPKVSGTRGAAANNGQKLVYTMGGNTIDIEDDTQQGPTITITNSNKTDTAITISFNGDGSIELKTQGKIDVTATQDLTLSGNNVNIKAQQKVKIDCTDFELDATDAAKISAVDIDLEASDSFKASGINSEMDGTAQCKVTSSGQLQIQGTMVQIN